MDAKTGRSERQEKVAGSRRRVIVVGTRRTGRWRVRMSLWRYLAASAISQ
jgi:hypothetical protein